MVFSKKRQKEEKVINITAKPILLKGKPFIKCVFRHPNKDNTYNYDIKEFLTLTSIWLEEKFYHADLFLTNETYQFLQNQKGKSTLLFKKASNILEDNQSHDHQKKVYVNPEGQYYRDLGLISGQGNLFSKGQKKYNQINKYIEMVSHLLSDEKPEGVFTIADMGSGKAYLTFALYDYLSTSLGWKVKITGYELRKDLVFLCNDVAAKMGFAGLSFVEAGIDKVPISKTDMVVALHACDIATDMAIHFGIECGAKYLVLAPCCQKQIRQNMDIQNVLSPVLKHGILLERQAELLTDGMRALLLEYKGYQSRVFEFVSLEHTSKNVMITAKKSKPDPKALDSFFTLKKQFGIKYHYLEKLMNLPL
ncbi:MAG: SAM-dependent methyltransferase [Saprospiraceae bacterium]|nr:SAM-dependent methyltransferase [Saprospiraceae bacterium]